MIDDGSSDYVPHRNRGLPSLRWDDIVNDFCCLVHEDSWQNVCIDVLNSSMDDFVQYFCNSYECS